MTYVIISMSKIATSREKYNKHMCTKLEQTSLNVFSWNVNLEIHRHEQYKVLPIMYRIKCLAREKKLTLKIIFFKTKWFLD